jgi:glycosyltransferase involved in cell wall biosynthesis
VPWVGWVADFQHHYLPENFSISERKKRDAIFEKMFTNCRSVIVGADSVKQDVHKLYPNSNTSVFVVPTIANPKKEWLLDSDQVSEKYEINKKYFMVSNQFWKHKNHITLFEAFTQFSQLNFDVDLVCTGALEDYRDPQHIDALKKLLKKNKIEERVHILGLIPKLDQISLLKSAIALIQPTLFEGGPGGGSVYDAIALGKICIVSSIPINKEINHDQTYFFDPHKPKELASLMLKISEQFPVLVVDEAALQQKGKIRMELALNALIESIEHAVSASTDSKIKNF